MKQRLLIFVTLIAAFAGSGCDSKSENPDQASSFSDRTVKPLVPPPPGGSGSRHQDSGDADLEIDERDYVNFPAVGVRIVRPKGFDEADGFHGFMQEDSQSSVLVMKVPGPFSEISSGFNEEKMKPRGMLLKGREEIEITGETGILVSLTQEAYGTEFSKWIVVFGNEEETTMVTATFPSSEEAALSGELRASVLSTRTDHVSTLDPEENIGFTIDQSQKLGGARDLGKMRMFTKDDVVPIESPEDPMFIVGPSLSRILIEDKSQFAHQRLMETAFAKVSALTSNRAISIGGLDGYEIVAEAQDTDSNTPLVVYQVILFEEEGSYILMQGLVGEKLRGEYLPEFKAMARSFRR